MSFEWDERKRRLNLQKHHVEFGDAVSALEDEDALTFPDDDSDEEDRFVTLGTDGLGRILVVVYTWRGDLVRVIQRERQRRESEGSSENDDETRIRLFECEARGGHPSGERKNQDYDSAGFRHSRLVP